MTILPLSPPGGAAFRLATLADHLADRDAAVRAAWVPKAAEAYLPVLGERAARFAAHVATMTIAPELAVWALAMAQRYGSWVRVHHFVADWITALLILRYGEEPDAARSTDPTFAGWPLACTADDLARAQQLLAGENWPARIFTMLPRHVPDVPAASVSTSTEA
jgi:hypothetical protein